LTSSKITISLFFFLISGVLEGRLRKVIRIALRNGTLDHNSIMDLRRIQSSLHTSIISRGSSDPDPGRYTHHYHLSLVNRPPHEHETKQPATSSQQYTFFDEKRDPLIDGGGGGESEACSVLTSTLDTSTACVRKLVFSLFHSGSLRMHRGARRRIAKSVGSGFQRAKHGSVHTTLRIIATFCRRSRVASTNIMHSQASTRRVGGANVSFISCHHHSFSLSSCFDPIAVDVGGMACLVSVLALGYACVAAVAKSRAGYLAVSTS
jgi:hypothetical protein